MATAPSVFDEAVVGLPTGSPGAVGPSPGTEVSQLPNGVRVASQDDGGHVASVALFFEAGSRFESSSNAGAAHLLSHMAFKSTNQRSDLRLFRDMEDSGMVSTAAHGRDSIMYRVDTLREHSGSALDIIAETVTDAKFPGWELNAVKAGPLAAELDGAETNAQSLLSETVHSAAYGGDKTALGHSLYAQRHNLSALDGDALSAYVNEHFSPHRMVIVGSNVDHATLSRFAESSLSGLGATGAAPSTDSTYTGGNKFLQGEGDLTHVAVAYNMGGWSDANLYSAMVLKQILGGGATGVSGIGSGVNSRLYKNVFGTSDQVVSAQAFSSVYRDSGLFGVYGACTHGSQTEAQSLLVGAMENAAKKAPSAEELNRAKNMLKSSIALSVASRDGNVEDMGIQTMVFGKRTSVAETFATIDSITAASVVKTAEALLKTNPTVAAIGSVDGL